MANKYGNKKVSAGGLMFDSKKERHRYLELLYLKNAGEVENIQTQVKFVLIPAQYEIYERYGKKGQRLKDGKRLVERECAYIADFVYNDLKTGKTIVEDTKGFKTPDYIIKRKLMLYIHGIRVREV